MLEDLDVQLLGCDDTHDSDNYKHNAVRDDSLPAVMVHVATEHLVHMMAAVFLVVLLVLMAGGLLIDGVRDRLVFVALVVLLVFVLLMLTGGLLMDGVRDRLVFVALVVLLVVSMAMEFLGLHLLALARTAMVMLPLGLQHVAPTHHVSLLLMMRVVRMPLVVGVHPCHDQKHDNPEERTEGTPAEGPCERLLAWAAQRGADQAHRPRQETSHKRPPMMVILDGILHNDFAGRKSVVVIRRRHLRDSTKHHFLRCTG